MQTVQIECTAFEGDNNVYLFEEDPVTLVDTAAATPQIRAQLKQGLAEYDVSFADIDRVLLTHFHADHSGLAGEIQKAGGASVYVHSLDAPLVQKEGGAWEQLWTKQRQRYDQWGMPEQKQAALQTEMLPERYGLPVDVTPYTAGDMFDVGEGTLSVVHTPGHTAGGASFEFSDGRNDWVFSGDALLPVYTPNIGGADLRIDHPLKQYLGTLHYFTQGSASQALPGHRYPIKNPTARATHIHRHHEERSMRILKALRRMETPTIWELAVRLFGELDGIHIRHGPGEVYAHIDHLERQGAVERSGGGAHLTEEAATAIESQTGDDERWPLELQSRPIR